MMSSRLSRLALLAGLVCLVLPAHADAQIGGFIKKKMKQAVKGDSTETKASPAGPTFDEYVLQLSSQNLDRLEQAMAGEKAFRDSALAAQAKRVTPAQYEECSLKTMRSPEAQAITANPPKDAAAFQKQNTLYEALLLKRCGANPNTFPELDLTPGADIGARAAGLKRQQYAIMKERVVPFCKSGGAGKVPGEARGMFYVYTAEEMAALKPRCTKLMSLLGKSFDTEDGPAAATGPKFDDTVLEMTPDVLTRLEKYYATMDARLATAKAPPTNARPKKEWDMCAQQFMTGPEGRAMMQNVLAGGRQADPQGMATAMNDAVEKKCGPNPQGTRVSKSSARDEAQRAAGLESGQISMMIERISPVCSTVAAEPNKPLGGRMLRMYSPAELKALPPRCARLTALIQKHQGNAPE